MLVTVTIRSRGHKMLNFGVPYVTVQISTTNKDLTLTGYINGTECKKMFSCYKETRLKTVIKKQDLKVNPILNNTMNWERIIYVAQNCPIRNGNLLHT